MSHLKLKLNITAANYEALLEALAEAASKVILNKVLIKKVDTGFGEVEIAYKYRVETKYVISDNPET